MSNEAMITQIQVEGTPLERQAIRSEVRTKVRQFLNKVRFGGVDRTEALYQLVKRVERGEEEPEVLKGVISSGHWLIELTEVQRKIETERAYRRLFGKERK